MSKNKQKSIATKAKDDLKIQNTIKIEVKEKPFGRASSELSEKPNPINVTISFAFVET